MYFILLGYSMKTRIIQTRFWEDDFVMKLSVDARLVFMYLLTNSSIGLTGIYEKPIGLIAVFVGISTARVENALNELSGKVIYDNGWVVLVNAFKYNNYASNERQRTAYMKEWNSLPERLKSYVPFFDDVKEYKPHYAESGKSYQHILIAEKVLGRKLLADEVVHHIDKDPSNNDIHNLAIMNKDTHRLLHQDKITLSDTTTILLSDYSNTTPKPKTKNKKSKIRNQKPKTQNGRFGNIKCFDDKEVQAMLKSEFPSVDVMKELQKMINYCKAHGKTYKDYRAFARNWLTVESAKHNLNKY